MGLGHHQVTIPTALCLRDKGFLPVRGLSASVEAYRPAGASDGTMASAFAVLVPTEVVYEEGNPQIEETNASSSGSPARDELKRRTMVGPTMDHSAWLRKQLEDAESDLLRDIVQGPPRPTNVDEIANEEES
jgi:hypothetical protein